MRKPCKI